MNVSSKKHLQSNIDDVLKLTESKESSIQKNEVLDSFDNLLDMSEFDGILQSIDNGKRPQQVQVTNVQPQKPQADILSELEQLEDQTKSGTIKNPNGEFDIHAFLGENEIENKQQQLERQRKEYEEQQRILEEQRQIQQQQMSQIKPPVIVPTSHTPQQSKPNSGVKYDPNVTFVLDDDDDDDWVPRMDDWDKIEKQREKERKEREKREKKLKKKKKGADSSAEVPGENVDVVCDNTQPLSSPSSPRGDVSSPRDEEPVEEVKSPRQEKVVWVHRNPDYNAPRKSFLDTRASADVSVQGDVDNESQVAVHDSLVREEVQSQELVQPQEVTQSLELIQPQEVIQPHEELKFDTQEISSEIQSERLSDASDIGPPPPEEDSEPIHHVEKVELDSISTVSDESIVPPPPGGSNAESTEELKLDLDDLLASNNLDIKEPPADDLVSAFDNIISMADDEMDKEMTKAKDTSEDTIKFLDDVINSFADEI